MPNANTLYTYGLRTDATRAERRLKNKQYAVRRSRHGEQRIEAVGVVAVLQAARALGISPKMISPYVDLDVQHLQRLRLGLYGDSPRMLWTTHRRFLEGFETLIGDYEEMLSDFASSVLFAERRREDAGFRRLVSAIPAIAAVGYARKLVTLSEIARVARMDRPYLAQMLVGNRPPEMRVDRYEKLVSGLRSIVQSKRVHFAALVRTVTEAQEAE